MIDTEKDLRVQIKFTTAIPPEKLRTLALQGITTRPQIKQWLKDNGLTRMDYLRWTTKEEFDLLSKLKQTRASK